LLHWLQPLEFIAVNATKADGLVVRISVDCPLNYEQVAIASQGCLDPALALIEFTAQGHAADVVSEFCIGGVPGTGNGGRPGD